MTAILIMYISFQLDCTYLVSCMYLPYLIYIVNFYCFILYFIDVRGTRENSYLMVFPG